MDTGTQPQKPVPYPTVSFYFMVTFPFSGGGIDLYFQSVSGLDSTLETEPIKEGGENRFTHVVPVRRKYGPLILKRGMPGRVNAKSTLTQKLIEVFGKDTFVPFDVVTIHLMNENRQTMMYWSINNVWPLSWKMSDLNAMQSEILIETMELNYNQLIFNP